MEEKTEDKYPYLLDALEKVLAYYKDNKSPNKIKKSFLQLEYYLYHQEEFTEEQKQTINKGLERIIILGAIKDEIKKLGN